MWHTGNYSLCMEWAIQTHIGLLQHWMGLFTGTFCSSMHGRDTSQVSWLWMTSQWVLSALVLVSWKVLLFVTMKLNLSCYRIPWQANDYSRNWLWFMGTDIGSILVVHVYCVHEHIFEDWLLSPCPNEEYSPVKTVLYRYLSPLALLSIYFSTAVLIGMLWDI